MTEQVPVYAQVLIWIMVGVMWAGIITFFVGFPLWALYLWSKHRNDPPQGEEDGDDGGGGGGRWDRPQGKPPGGGGPDRGIDEMFHEVADAIGKTIKIEEKDKEQVLQ